MGYGAQVANELADGVAEFDRPACPVAVPERHLARFARRRRHEHAIVRDLLDAPGRRAQRERFADSRFEHHLLVELADAHGPVRPCQKDAVEAAVRDGAGVGDGNARRAFAAGYGAGDPIPGHSRAQLGKFVGRIPSRQHVEDPLEHMAAQIRERGRPADGGEEVVHRPTSRGRPSRRCAAPGRRAGCVDSASIRPAPRASRARRRRRRQGRRGTSGR